MIRGNTTDFIDHPLPKDSVSAHGASHHAWAPGPHHLNPALKRTFADLLPCYYYKIKTNSKTFHSQVWQLAPAGSIVASPKILGGNKIFGGRQNV